MAPKPNFDNPHTVNMNMTVFSTKHPTEPEQNPYVRYWRYSQQSFCPLQDIRLPFFKLLPLLYEHTDHN